MKRVLALASAVVLSLAIAAPALAIETQGTGRDFGQHHAQHAREMGGFTGTMNPGVMHRGFAGWMGR